MNTLTKQLIAGLCVLSLMVGMISLRPAMTQAQGMSVPIDTMFNWHNIQQQTKDFVLNGLAWSVAKMLVQQITTSVVNWINTGFEGSPAFLTNPEGFFLDVGDQLTGEFISQNGDLRNLCSPWSTDIRLAIGIGQMRTASQRYTCTLSTIIDNTKGSIEGFTGGDFSQGGWPAFISLTTEPQNNPYGIYLQAKSDIENRIDSKQTSINQDLNRGQGFMSWQKCTEISQADASQTTQKLGLDDSGLYRSDGSSATNNVLRTGNGTGITSSVDAKGVTTFKSCSTQTPGSVINSSLEKSLGAGVDQLNLADSINEITSALFAQLMTQVLSKGLGGTTQRTSGTTRSYVDQLYLETNSPAIYGNSGQNISASYAPYVTDAEKIRGIYQEAVSSFDTARNNFNLAMGCYQNISLTGLTPTIRATAVSNISEIQNILTSQLAVDESTYQTKLDRANTTVASINTGMKSAGTINSVEDVQKNSNDLQIFVNTQVPQIRSDLETAPTDLTAAKAKAAQLNTTAKTYQQQCQALGSGSSSRF